MSIAELLLAGLSVGLAIVCFTIAAVVVPRIALPTAGRSATVAFRATAAALAIIGGIVNLQAAGRALLSSESVGADELVLPALQFAGGSLFVLVAMRYLYIGLWPNVRLRENRVRELERLALRDPLTGAHNRRYFNEALGNEVHRFHRYHRPVSMVLFDVDDLKAINDRGGHAAGDWALRNIARAAEEAVRGADSVVRLGGDEFALLLPETDHFRASIVAERLRAAVAELSMPAVGGTSISAGIASLPRHGETAEELQARADQALYWAKTHGKNRCATARYRADQASRTGAYAARAS